MMDKTQNTVRINAGIWRSRQLKFPTATGLRPTPDRVRQTVFNWLGQDLTGLYCLDLFAGTGVMGFEALSRGAKYVTLVEKDAHVFQALKGNQVLLKANDAELVHTDALQFLNASQQAFDVVFCDPPYAKNLLSLVLPQLLNRLKPGAFVYAEAEYLLASDADWQVVKQGKAGNVYYHLLKSNHEPSRT